MAKVKAVDANLHGERPDYSAGMPENRQEELTRALLWYNYHTDVKSLRPKVDAYMKTVLEVNTFKMFKNGTISFTAAKLITMVSTGWEPNGEEQAFIDHATQKAIDEGRDKIDPEEAKSNVVVLSPAERLRNKVRDTIISDLDTMEDAWCEQNDVSINVYDLMKGHDLKGSVPSQMVKDWAQARLDDYICARDKEDEQCVEGFKHIPAARLKKRIKILEQIIADAESFAQSVKAVRAPRKKKPKAATSQVSKIKYQKESSEYKISSIDPAQIVGAMRVLTFNTKNRELTEYVSYRREGFEIKGTTLQHFDTEQSRKTKLRKPEEMIKLALTKSAKQIDNAWQKLTTKSSAPNGRFNEDTIILRVMK